MYVADQLLQVIARTRHQELLAEAEKWRLVRLPDEAEPVKLYFWRRLRWQVGQVIIVAGHKLQASYQPEHESMMRLERNGYRS